MHVHVAMLENSATDNFSERLRSQLIVVVEQSHIVTRGACQCCIRGLRHVPVCFQCYKPHARIAGVFTQNAASGFQR